MAITRLGYSGFAIRLPGLFGPKQSRRPATKVLCSSAPWRQRHETTATWRATRASSAWWRFRRATTARLGIACADPGTAP